MQILRKGNLPENDIYIGTCNYCKCKIQIQRKEGKFQSCQWDGKWVDYACPTEGCKTTIHCYKMSKNTMG